MSTFNFTTTSTTFSLNIGGAKTYGPWDRVDEIDSIFNIVLEDGQAVLTLNNPYFSDIIKSTDTVNVDAVALTGTLRAKVASLKDNVLFLPAGNGGSGAYGSIAQSTVAGLSSDFSSMSDAAATLRSNNTLTVAANTFTASAANSYGVLDKYLPSSVSGLIQATYLNSGNAIGIIGMDTNKALNNYSSPWKYEVYVLGGTYYTAENTASGTNSTIAATAGDLYRIRRDGVTGTVVAEYSSNSGGLWTTIRTFPTTYTGVLYYKIAQTTNGNRINSVIASIPAATPLENKDILVYDPVSNKFKNEAASGYVPVLPITQYGGNADGVTDNGSAFSQSLSSSNKQVFFPQNSTNNAIYYFTSFPVLTGAVISADAGVKLSFPSTNNTTFSSTTFTTSIQIISRDRNNTGQIPRSDVPDWVFKATDDLNKPRGLQLPLVLDATTLTKRKYSTSTTSFVTGLATLTSTNTVTWAQNAFTITGNPIDIVGLTPTVGKEYKCSILNATMPTTNAREGILIAWGGGDNYTFFNIDGTGKWYAGDWNGTAYSETTGVSLPTNAYAATNNGSSTLISFRITDANTVEFFVNGMFVVRKAFGSAITFGGFGWFGNAVTGGAATAYDFVYGDVKSAFIGKELKVDFYGDSQTFGEAMDITPPNAVKQILEGRSGIGKVTINNYAVSGVAAAAQLTTLNTNGAVGKDAIVVMIGTNDIQNQTTIATFKTTIGSIIAKIKTDGSIPIICIPYTFISSTLTGIGYSSANYDKGGIYRSAIWRVAAEQGGCYVADVNAAIGAVGATNQQLRDNLHHQPAWSATIAVEMARTILQALAPAVI